MERIQYQKHTVETLHYNLARMLERVGYYGMRALIILYMVREQFGYSSGEAFNMYDWLITSIIISSLVGASLGDLILGNKRTALIGGVIQSLGAFALALPSEITLFGGISLFALGNGMFVPNLNANYGKSYLNKPKLLDSAFTFFYSSINIGAMIGALLIGMIGEQWGYSYGFIISGVFSLLGLIPLSRTTEPIEPAKETAPVHFNRRVLSIVMVIVLSLLFWGVFEIASMRTEQMEDQMASLFNSDILQIIWNSLGSVLSLFVTIVAGIVWTFYYSSPFTKLLQGFIMGALALLILLFAPQTLEANHAIYYIIAMLLIAIAEISLVPVIDSTITRFSNPKYIAILMAAAFIPTRIVMSFIVGSYEEINANPTTRVQIGLAILVIGAITISLFKWRTRHSIQ